MPDNVIDFAKEKDKKPRRWHSGLSSLGNDYIRLRYLLLEAYWDIEIDFNEPWASGVKGVITSALMEGNKEIMAQVLQLLERLCVLSEQTPKGAKLTSRPMTSCSKQLTD
jgi:hypothetical protein